jgi:hypothetical protein
MAKNVMHVLRVASNRLLGNRWLWKTQARKCRRRQPPLLCGNVGIPATDVDEFVVNVKWSCGIAWKKKRTMSDLAVPMQVPEVGRARHRVNSQSNMLLRIVNMVSRTKCPRVQMGAKM